MQPPSLLVHVKLLQQLLAVQFPMWKDQTDMVRVVKTMMTWEVMEMRNVDCRKGINLWKWVDVRRNPALLLIFLLPRPHHMHAHHFTPIVFLRAWPESNILACTPSWK